MAQSNKEMIVLIKKTVPFVIAMLFVAGCGTNAVKSTPKNVEITKSSETVTQVITTQVMDSIKLGSDRERIIQQFGEPQSSNPLDWNNADLYIVDIYPLSDSEYNCTLTYEGGKLVDKALSREN